MSIEDALRRKLERERSARAQAEQILEQKSLELWRANEELRAAAEDLEARIADRTKVLAETAAALERANRAQARFLANISHELRSPLTAVMGYANLLQGAVTPGTESAEWAGSLLRSAEHLLGLVGDILDLTKIEAGGLELNLEPTYLARELTEIVRLFQANAAERCLSLDLVINGELPRSIRCDPLRLRQIVINLVSNALKFTHDGGVTVDLRLTSATAEQPAIEIAVTDTGVGIAEDQLENIFLPFTQTRDASYGGTGLGLDIARRLATRLGGTLTVRSQPGHGSTFTLTLPVDHVDLDDLVAPSELQTSARSPEQSVPPRSLIGRTILVADDSADNRRILERFLVQAGASVQLATNGAEAVERAQRENTTFDLVLMDVRMPVMDGLQATQLLRSDGYAGLIVALTADATVEARHACLEAGCDDYVVKPVIRRALLARLEGLVSASPTDTKRYQRPTTTRRTHQTLARTAPPPATADAAPPRANPDLPDWLISEYVDALAERSDQLAQALDAGDRNTIRSIAHEIAGTGTSYGFAKLTELGFALQAAVDENAAEPAIVEAAAALGRRCQIVVAACSREATS